MRLFELLLILATILLLLMPRARDSRIMWLVYAAVGVIALFHWSQEGTRWQMALVYATLGLLLALTIAGVQMPWVWLGRVGQVLGILGCLITAGFALIFPINQLVELSGPYKVGTASYHMVDLNRPETYSEDPHDVRQLMTQVWYPVAQETDTSMAQRADYLPNMTIGAPAIASVFNFPSFILNHLSLIETRSYENVPVAADGPYPIIIFSHGLSGTRIQNTQQVEELASQGYIVVATDHPYGAAYTVYPDNRVINYRNRIIPWDTPNEISEAHRLVDTWTADLHFMVAELEAINTNLAHPLSGSFNFEQIGVFGHSTGGGTAYQFCAGEPRCKAALGLDPWVVPTADQVLEDGLDTPVMIIKSPKKLSDLNEARLDMLRETSRQNLYDLEVGGTAHFDFTDFKQLSPALMWVDMTGSIRPNQINQIMNEYALAFFNFHVRGWQGARLFADSAEFPEVTFTRTTR